MIWALPGGPGCGRKESRAIGQQGEADAAGVVAGYVDKRVICEERNHGKVKNSFGTETLQMNRKNRMPFQPAAFEFLCAAIPRRFPRKTSCRRLPRPLTIGRGISAALAW